MLYLTICGLAAILFGLGAGALMVTKGAVSIAGAFSLGISKLIERIPFLKAISGRTATKAFVSLFIALILLSWIKYVIRYGVYF